MEAEPEPGCGANLKQKITGEMNISPAISIWYSKE
jgi:hypothetical protein